jgi:hypothetical protein
MALGGDDRDGGVGVGLAELFGCGLAGDAVAENDVAAGAQTFSAPEALGRRHVHWLRHRRNRIRKR